MPMTPPKTYHVKSFGCQMNVYDGERMGELLDAEGMAATSEAEADLVVLNTCHDRGADLSQCRSGTTARASPR